MAEMSGERFEQMRADALDIFDSDTRIPGVGRHGDYLYHFWQDAAHPRGLWRRTTLEEYRKDSPEWDVVIDVDALAAAEDENWVWAGGDINAPGFTHAVVALSRGGGGRERGMRIRHDYKGIRRRRIPAARGQLQHGGAPRVGDDPLDLRLVKGRDHARGRTPCSSSTTSSSSPERQNRGWCSIPTVKNSSQPECSQATDSSA
jgi:hypothetical protein